jgi:cell division protein FtsQ
VTEEQRESLVRRLRREWRRRKPLAVVVRTWRYIAARRVLAAVIAALVVVTTGTIAYATGVFDVRHVQVVGASRATTGRIDSLAHSAVGNSMLTVNTSSLRRRIAAMPEVAAVHVARQWPDTLRLTVTERLAVVAVHQPGGWLLIDRTATPYLTVTQLPARVLPLDVATAATAGDPTLRAAVDVVLVLPSSVRSTVDAVSAPSVAGIELRLRGGGTVIWGGPEDSLRKARALAVLLAQQQRTHAHTRVYDVSTPGFVTTS